MKARGCLVKCGSPRSYPDGDGSGESKGVRKDMRQRICDTASHAMNRRGCKVRPEPPTRKSMHTKYETNEDRTARRLAELEAENAELREENAAMRLRIMELETTTETPK